MKKSKIDAAIDLAGAASCVWIPVEGDTRDQDEYAAAIRAAQLIEAVLVLCDADAQSIAVVRRVIASWEGE
jgi:hypothetical protein